MPHIESLTLGHIKSCARTEVQTLRVGVQGPLLDRHWMVVDARTNKFVLSDKKPEMSQIHSAVIDQELQIAYEGSRLSIPITDDGARGKVLMFDEKEHDAVDDGNEAADWFTDILQIPVRLVHVPEDRGRTDSLGLAQFGFADSWAFTLSSVASLRDLNMKIQEHHHEPVPKERFGHNIWIDGVPPYAEDEWAEIVINGLSLLVVKPVVRCARTLVQRESPENIRQKDKEPLSTLSKYRRTEAGVIFGQKMAHQGEGRISVGDEIRVIRHKEPPTVL